MNPKIVKLLHEGFSITTLDKFSEKQINVLYEKLNKKETKEAITKTTTSTTYTDDELKKGVPGGKVIIKNPDNTTTVTKEGEIGESEMTEKAVSKKQHGLMGAAYAVEKGEKKLKDIPKNYRGKVKDVVQSMTKKQIGDFAKTKTDKLPEKKESKKEVKKLEENIMKLIESHLPPHTTKGELLSSIRTNKR
jgi:hypothetical protein